MTDVLLSAEEAAAAWGNLEASVATDADQVPRHYLHYRPLVDAAKAFVREAQDQRRIYTGTPEFDDEMRGIGSGHLCVVTGYSHSGKNVWVNKLLRYNKSKRVAFFGPDEPATLVLSKLASVESGVAARELEQRVAENDHDAIKLLRDTALIDFPNLIVFDKPLTAEVMRSGLDEARSVWGAKEDLIIIDYVDLLQAGETVQAKFDFIKGFGSREEVPIIAIHQTSRGAGAEGRKMTISSGNYGGEQHATFMVGVRRKKSALLAEREELLVRVAKGSETAEERLDEVNEQLRIHQYTITVNLVKNKRPGGGLVDDIDLELDTDTGRLFDLDGHYPQQYLAEQQELIRTRRAASPRVEPTWDEQELF